MPHTSSGRWERLGRTSSCIYLIAFCIIPLSGESSSVHATHLQQPVALHEEMLVHNLAERRIGSIHVVRHRVLDRCVADDVTVPAEGGTRCQITHTHTHTHTHTRTRSLTLTLTHSLTHTHTHTHTRTHMTEHTYPRLRCRTWSCSASGSFSYGLSCMMSDWMDWNTCNSELLLVHGSPCAHVPSNDRHTLPLA